MALVLRSAVRAKAVRWVPEKAVQVLAREPELRKSPALEPTGRRVLQG